MPDLTSANITLDSEKLQNPDKSMRLEWIATNAIGGYASSSVGGANTRRYHGLLVAAVNPPVERAVLLSKLEETLEIIGPDGVSSPTFGLSANIYPESTYPQGYRHLESWDSSPCPRWVFCPQPGVLVEKRIWMAQGSNTTYIAYRLLEAPDGATANMHLVPLLAWKGYHGEMHAGDEVVRMEWYPYTSQVARLPGASESLLRVNIPTIWPVTKSPMNLDLHIVTEEGSPYPDTAFASQAHWYYRFQHPCERERGMDSEEDLYSLGMFSTNLKVGETVVLTATTEEQAPASPADSWQRLLEHQTKLSEGVALPDEFSQRLAAAADQFIVQCPNGRSSIIAGYPWFGDWGRDTMIALPGLCLSTGRLELAREILLSFSEFVDQGMIPNRFPDYDQPPEYNTVDATLWYFAAIYHYIAASGDIALLRDSLWPVLQQIIHAHQEGTRYNIRVDTDSLLYAGQAGVQLTWMDAKVGDWVVTPRIGKPVEINALWHNALQTMSHFAKLLDNSSEASRYSLLAQTTAAMFTARFTRPDGKGLYDVLDTPNKNAPDDCVRPNQIFALSLPFAPLKPVNPTAHDILMVVQEELVTPYGLRSLSPKDHQYRARYEGDSWSRDGAYHQGTVWTWLLGPYVEAHYKVFRNKAVALSMLQALQDQMSVYGMGSLAEVYDGDEPHRPAGCIAQAWSIAETLRVWKALQKK